MTLVPHSQCSLREIPKFLQNLKLKYNKIKFKFLLIFLFHVCQGYSGLALKSKKYFVQQISVYFIGENFRNLRQ
jgi:hypothetical protein